MKKHSIQGSNLISVMIIIGILGIIATIAIPSYQNYSRKTYYTQVIKAAQFYRESIVECVQKLGTLTGCSAGSNGVPNGISKPEGVISSISVTNGIIVVTPIPNHGVTEADTYVLTPTVDTTTGTITWIASGGGVSNGYNS